MKRKCLAVGIILLFVGTCITPGIAQNTEKQSSRGNWLYVGGSGPGNYTSIQAAVNASTDGDTIFVYHNSSPYHETLIVKTSITLTGENKESTIIDGGGLRAPVVTIYADHVVLSSFTIQNATLLNPGIFLQANDSIVTDNILQYNGYCGVEINFSDRNVIQGNYVLNNGKEGITCTGSANMITENEVISNNEAGISFSGAFQTNISYNTVVDHVCGIEFYELNNNNNVYKNTITLNQIGVEIDLSSKNTVLRNNFINDTLNAQFKRSLYSEIILKQVSLQVRNYRVLKNYQPIGRNIWDGNYWGHSRILPYPIIGRCGYLFTHPILGVDNRIAFDWHPAQEPYDIPEMS